MTAVDIDIIAPSPQPDRDRYGRYLIPTPDGKRVAHTRVTTVASTLEDRYNLEQWGQRMVAFGVAQRRDLLDLALTHNPDTDKGVYRDIVKDALATAKSKAKASTGTALHRASDIADRLGLDEVPERFHERIGTYQAKLAECGITVDPDGIERILVLDGYQVAGTCDRVPVIVPPDMLPGGDTRLIADLKTGSLYGWLDKAVQLAAYANHDATYDPTTKTRGPRIDVSRKWGIIIHLPADGGDCTLHRVDLEAGWDMFLTSMEAREHRRTADSLAEPLTGPPAPTVDPIRAWVAQRIVVIYQTSHAALAELVNRWPAGVPAPLPATFTDDQLTALSAALSAVEANHEIPFGPEQPGLENQDQTWAHQLAQQTKG